MTAPQQKLIAAQEPPGPIPDAQNPETILRDLFVKNTVQALEHMVAALKSGACKPVRALYLIETFAATQKTHIAEVDNAEAPPGGADEDEEFGLALNPRRGRHRLGQRVGRGPVNLEYPLHGGGGGLNGMNGMLMEALEKQNNVNADGKREKKILSLIESISAAGKLNDPELVTRLRAELAQVMGPATPDVARGMALDVEVTPKEGDA